MGRRVRKLVYNYDGAAWQLQSDRRFVWDEWNLVMFLDGQNSNAIVRKQVWGLDLSGLGGNATARGIHGAGGIGGLLAAVETQGTYQGSYWYLYDGNGNVAQVLSASSYSVVAHYEYDPYGNAIVATGSYATANPYRFSTKHWDAVIGLGYWGYRYYSPTTGRWLSRDPIEEEGGLNLYQYASGDPSSRWDPFGLSCCPAGWITVAHNPCHRVVYLGDVEIERCVEAGREKQVHQAEWDCPGPCGDMYPVWCDLVLYRCHKERIPVKGCVQRSVCRFPESSGGFITEIVTECAGKTWPAAGPPLVIGQEYERERVDYGSCGCPLTITS